MELKHKSVTQRINYSISNTKIFFSLLISVLVYFSTSLDLPFKDLSTHTASFSTPLQHLKVRHNIVA